MEQKKNNRGLLAAIVALAALAGTCQAFAAGPSWAHQNGSLNSNGAIVIKSLSGGSYNAVQNPTGAIAKTNQNAATQPPTVIVQATARPPVVVEGAACNAANDSMGIDAAQTMLLTCQGSVWRRFAVQRTGDTMTGRLSSQHDDWALVLRNAAGVDNAQVSGAAGSAYVNDIYIRSVGKWASQLGGFSNFTTADGPSVCRGGESRAYCPGGTRMISGGFYITAFTSDMNAPDNSLPEPWNNAWVIKANGSGGCHAARVLCGY
jgi:hypothetical protein